jgi:uncharacterized integral membrane protein
MTTTKDAHAHGAAGRPHGLPAAVRAYWKLGLGLLLVALLVVFVAQNADSIHVKLFAWETDMSQALVVFLAVLAGVVFGVVFNRWERWRSSRRR